MDEFCILIATRNRPKQLELLLISIAKSDVSGLLFRGIYVADSSLSDQTMKIVNGFESLLPIQYFRLDEKFTLPQKRNFLINQIQMHTEIDSMIFLFFDDDIQIDKYLIRKTLSAFRSVNIVGVGGRDLNSGFKEVKKWQELLQINSKIQGKILKSGQNIAFHDSESPTKVDWISGCFMAFRAKIFNQTSFDENRKFDGEDVDICLKASQFGELYIFPDITFVHESALSELPNQNHKFRDFLYHRCSLIFSKNADVRMIPSMLSIAGLGVAIIFRSMKVGNFKLMILGLKHIFGVGLIPFYSLFLFLFCNKNDRVRTVFHKLTR